MLRVFIVISIVAFLWWFLFSFNKAPAAQRKQLLTKFLLYSLAGLFLILVVTGRAPWFFAIIGAAIPWIQRLLVVKNAWNSFKPKTGSAPSSGKQSTVQSEYLTMTLDHDSGEMNGNILKGDFAGQALKDLDQEQLLSFYNECSIDQDSQNLLSAYLDFRFEDQWRNQHSSQQSNQQTHSNKKISQLEAFAILGLPEGASKKEIIQAHKKLMQKMHPDRGGSEYLASKINQAKSILLD